MSDAPRIDWKPEARAISAEDATTKRKTGRRSRLDYAADPSNDPRCVAMRAWRAELIARLEAGGADANVCAAMMLPVGVFYRWLTDGEDREPSEAEPRGHRGRSPFREFREDVMRARAASISNHELVIAHASTTDWRASAWMLSRRDPARYSERFIMENRHTNGTGTGPVAVTTATPAELVAAVLAVAPDQRMHLAGLVTDDLAPLDGDAPAEDDRGAS